MDGRVRPTPTSTDGGTEAAARTTIRIDPTNEAERWRYRCPNGHAGTAWSPTNSHIYCHSCKKQMDSGSDVSPEHYAVVDAKTGELIPWSSVEVLK